MNIYSEIGENYNIVIQDEYSEIFCVTTKEEAKEFALKLLDQVKHLEELADKGLDKGFERYIVDILKDISIYRYIVNQTQKTIF